MTHTIGMISLGCAKNQVNAEQMLYLLRQAGYEILPEPEGAELVIINTCGFIDSAKEEAIDHILAMGALKQEGRVGKILVTGCLAQRYQEEIRREEISVKRKKQLRELPLRQRRQRKQAYIQAGLRHQRKQMLCRIQAVK